MTVAVTAVAVAMITVDIHQVEDILPDTANKTPAEYILMMHLQITVVVTQVVVMVYIGAKMIENDSRNTSARLQGERQTNQRTEAAAVAHALEQSRLRTERLEIMTDSQYVIKGVNEWSNNWQKNDWKTSSGSDVQNRDLFERIIDLKDSKPGEVEVSYVPGHQGVETNKLTDLQ